MSAYIVDKEHIAYLVGVAMQYSDNRGAFAWFHADEWHKMPFLDWEKAADVANMLWRENIRSVSYRYPNESSATLPGPNKRDEFLVQSTDLDLPYETNHAQIFKACDCYAYQTCEHPEWEQSEAYAFIQALRNQTWRNLPGYESAEWGAPVRQRAAA